MKYKVKDFIKNINISRYRVYIFGRAYCYYEPIKAWFERKIAFKNKQIAILKDENKKLKLMLSEKYGVFK